MSKRLKLTVIGLLMSLFLVSAVWAQQDVTPFRDFGGIANATRVEGISAGLVLNPEGKGDLLIFPYYDVRTINSKNQDTLFMIINETTNTYTSPTNHHGVAAKLRFREWDKSEEVFDADIWLSDNDVWVGVVRLNATTNIANIWSSDWVIYDFTADYFIVKKLLDNSGAGYDFITQNITFTLPSGWTKEKMTQLGYFEVIGEERTETKVSTTYPDRVYRLDESTEDAGYQYPDCPNSLMGTAYILRSADGVAMGYNATAFANFSVNNRSLFVAPGSLNPQLSSAEDTLDQLEFQLSKEDIFGAYSIESSIAGKASLIITFPTKHYHYDANRNRIVTSNNPYLAAKENDGEVITVTIYDRNENKITPDKSWWSPPPTIPPLSLPYEVNICGFYAGTSPTIAGRDNVAFPTSTFDSGWVWVWFGDAAHGSRTAFPILIDDFQYFGNRFSQYNGLPALALQVQEFSNTSAGGYYGEISDAWYEVEWFRVVAE